MSLPNPLVPACLSFIITIIPKPFLQMPPRHIAVVAIVVGQSHLAVAREMVRDCALQALQWHETVFH